MGSFWTTNWHMRCIQFRKLWTQVENINENRWSNEVLQVIFDWSKIDITSNCFQFSSESQEGGDMKRKMWTLQQNHFINMFIWSCLLKHNHLLENTKCLSPFWKIISLPILFKYWSLRFSRSNKIQPDLMLKLNSLVFLN